jgi:hypothetical protein
MIERQGRSFVLYAGLLDAAHAKGLKSIRTRLVQSPAPENGDTTICLAEVELEDGRLFSGLGDATPQNVGRAIVPHAIRMAETRAKARALRDAINVGAVAVEELGDLDEPSSDDQRESVELEMLPTRGGLRPPAAQRPPQRLPTPPTPIASRQPTADGDIATPAQVRAIYLIGRDQHSLTDAQVDERAVDLYGAPPAELTKKQASNLITVLKGGQQPAAS